MTGSRVMTGEPVAPSFPRPAPARDLAVADHHAAGTTPASQPTGEPAYLDQHRLRVRKFMPGVEGLRAVAIVLVLGFHAGLPGFTLGWTGVQLFFVISGFLITGILLDTKGEPHYARNFYVRRGLRILPAYYLTLAVVVAWQLLFVGPASGWAWYAFYGQNYLLGVSGFHQSFPWAMNHTWSLAVEEQFYFVWPLVVLLLSKRALSRLVVILLVAAPVLRLTILLATGNQHLTYTPLPMQVDALAIGGGLALLFRSSVPDRTLRRLLNVMLLVGLAAAAVLVAFFYSSSAASWALRMPNVLLQSSLAVLFGGLVGSAALGRRGLDVLLSNRPTRYVGRISYGLYLYHFPMFWILPALWPRLLPWDYESFPRPVQIIILLGATLLAAAVSWRFIESPLLRLKKRFP